MFAMNTLPISIEKYLTDEAGFSPSELLVLIHLLTGEAMTLRTLAAKTGKSTGALDQAVKKLLKRSIIARQQVNGSPKFVLSSPESMRNWMRRDIHSRKQILHRREQDFESFVSGIQLNLSRPHIEYFEGQEGMEKAYRKLLDLTDKELFSYMPIAQREQEEGTHMALHERYAKERRKRKIFLRVLSCNTPLGRRFQSRDHFEYRQTVLVAEFSYPLSYEKIIAGDTVACFNHRESRVCFVHYPDLAFAEKKQFELIVAKTLSGPPDVHSDAEKKDVVLRALEHIPFLSKNKT